MIFTVPLLPGGLLPPPAYAVVAPLVARNSTAILMRIDMYPAALRILLRTAFPEMGMRPS
jgi:hypothetical protein